MNNLPEQTLLRYLLDDMPDAERISIEKAYFGDPSLLDHLASFESDLIDDYVNGRLSDEIKKRFEVVYTTSPAKIERVAFARAFGTTVANSPSSGPEEVSKPFVDSLGELLQDWWLPIRLAGAFAALIVVVIGGAWFFFPSLNKPDVEVAVAPPLPTVTPAPENSPEIVADPSNAASAKSETPRPTPSPTPKSKEPGPSRVLVLALTAGGLRGSGSEAIPTLAISDETQEVQLSLRLSQNAYPEYRYAIQTSGGAEIVPQTRIKSVRSGSGAAFLIKAPARILSNGEYILTLSGTSADGSSDNISRSLFRIRKP